MTSATAVVEPSVEKFGQTKFPRLQEIGRPRYVDTGWSRCECEPKITSGRRSAFVGSGDRVQRIQHLVGSEHGDAPPADLEHGRSERLSLIRPGADRRDAGVF